jgi:hypothetical protein
MKRIHAAGLQFFAFIFALYLAPPLLAADPGRCFVCGAAFGLKVYLVTDQVTMEKVRVCGNCVMGAPDCFVCGVPAQTNAPGFLHLSDGRVLCERDAKTAVLREDEGIQLCFEARDTLNRLFSRFISFPQENVTVTVVDRVHLQELFKLSGFRCPNVWGITQPRSTHNKVIYKVSIMTGLPRSWFQATCAHEYTHVWVNEHLSEARRQTLGHDAEEGFCELVSYLLVDAQHDENQKAAILRNAYTRGQVDLFIDAERRFGFNEVVDWIQYGEDEELSASDPGRVRKLIAVHRPSTAAPALAVYKPAAVTTPTNLLLRAIFWDPSRPTAVINDRTFGPNEQGKVRLGTTNVSVRCLAIRKDGVRVRLVDSAEERELTVQPVRH